MKKHFQTVSKPSYYESGLQAKPKTPADETGAKAEKEKVICLPITMTMILRFRGLVKQSQCNQEQANDNL